MTVDEARNSIDTAAPGVQVGDRNPTPASAAVSDCAVPQSDAAHRIACNESDIKTVRYAGSQRHSDSQRGSDHRVDQPHVTSRHRLGSEAGGATNRHRERGVGHAG
jgi:hypothetical protein